MTDPVQTVRDLHELLAKEPQLEKLLVRSLTEAKERAEQDLDRELFDALDWPTDLDGYDAYLEGFIRWIPQQSDHPAWRTSAPEERYAKEVSDRLAHFFWIIDQDVHEDGGAIAEGSESFRRWLTDFARAWGSFLDTPESFSDEILQSFLDNAPEYHVEESLVDGRPNAPSGWLTFNQFFARELNRGLRPISEPTDNRVVTSPADCSYQHRYDIGADSEIPATRIKRSHSYGNIEQLLEGSEYADAFAGGTFVHYMLPPSAYHRYHLPVAGEVKEAFTINGQVYMEVDLSDHQLQSKDSTDTGYEFFQTRGVVTLDTGAAGQGDLGIVAVVPVGMSHVASVNLTATPGTTMAKGEEFGYFLFGGSDIIVLFQEGVEVEVDTDTDPRKVGSVIARATER
ncbi:MAG TPA: phosphatidylserine decarboxylase [Marmoricola sp.]|nr:phosphatidylserine decarboxylase [Marmoricola sp.]